MLIGAARRPVVRTSRQQAGVYRNVSWTMQLSQLQQDLLGDLAEHTHGIWEVFAFVKLHHPLANDAEIFFIGREVLQRRIERGWLLLAAQPLQPTTVTTLAEAIRLLDSMGSSAIRYREGAPMHGQKSSTIWKCSTTRNAGMAQVTICRR